MIKIKIGELLHKAKPDGTIVVKVCGTANAWITVQREEVEALFKLFPHLVVELETDPLGWLFKIVAIH
jgi:hypothetical protein